MGTGYGFQHQNPSYFVLIPFASCHSSTTPIGYRVPAAHSSWQTYPTKIFLGNCSLNLNDVPWSQSGQEQKPKPRQEGKGRQQSSFLFVFLTSKAQRVGDEAGGSPRRQREGEPPAIVTAATQEEENLIDPDFYFKDRGCTAISWSHRLFIRLTRLRKNNRKSALSK